MISIILFAVLLVQSGQSAAAVRLYKNDIYSAASSERLMEAIFSKGVLERRLRLRARLNTHLLKKQ